MNIRKRGYLPLKKIIIEGFKIHDDPFVKSLDVELQNIGMEGQQYFGGNHLKVRQLHIYFVRIKVMVIII